ncbi:TWiK family of potassium channels protein 18 isoform X2 [Nilaparvata lugens]|nr:TWiK family of potassium channels protein 18 isoform X2 [Nilaparvata lugens]
MERKRGGSRRSYGAGAGGVGGGGRRRKAWTEQCKDYVRNFVAFMFSNIGIIGLVIGYTIAGSFMFMAIEKESVNTKVDQVVRARNTTVANLWQATCCTINLFSEETWRNTVHVELLAFQKSVVNAVQNDGYEGEQLNGNRWSFSGAFLYSLSVITTIGYGNVAPRTEWGKLATILYAIAGMPLFLLYLSNIGDLLAKSFKWTYAKCCLCRGCARRRRQMSTVNNCSQAAASDSAVAAEDSCSSRESSGSATVSDDDDDPQTVTVPITLCLAIMVGYVYGGAVLFSRWESWDLLDGSYFCFISLSTIGFGDIVPRDDKITSLQGVGLSFIFCSMYLMLGMALIAMCFNLMQEEVVHKFRTCGDVLRRIVRCRR